VINMDLKKELEELSERYVTAGSGQRLNVIDQRLHNPAAIPNRLVTRVAAIEGLIRSLLMHTHASTKQELKKLYPKFRYRKVQTMIAEYLKHKRDKSPEEYFGKDTWSTFKIAVEYRNLLVHECTYLGNYKYGPLEEACRSVYESLVKLSRLKRKNA